VKNPVSELNTKMALVWALFSIIGAALVLFAGSPLAGKAGGLMLSMCAGYVFFGFGVQRSHLSEKP
jgi:hypothetical protein